MAVGWLLAAYLLGVVGFAILHGWVEERYGEDDGATIMVGVSILGWPLTAPVFGLMLLIWRLSSVGGWIARRGTFNRRNLGRD